MSLLNYNSNNNDLDLLQMNVATMTNVQKRRAKQLLENMLGQLEGKPMLISGDIDLPIKCDGTVVYIDMSKEVCGSSEDMPLNRARMNRLSDMFMNGLLEYNDDIKTDEYNPIIKNEDNTYDINDRIKDAENNLKALKKMIDVIKRARDNGATRLATVDFDDFDKFGEENQLAETKCRIRRGLQQPCLFLY